MTNFFPIKTTVFMEWQPAPPFHSSEQVRLIVEAIVSYLQNRSFDNISQQNLNMRGQTSSWLWLEEFCWFTLAEHLFCKFLSYFYYVEKAVTILLFFLNSLSTQIPTHSSQICWPKFRLEHTLRHQECILDKKAFTVERLTYSKLFMANAME